MISSIFIFSLSFFIWHFCIFFLTSISFKQCNIEFITVYYVMDTVLGVLYIFTHLTLITALEVGSTLTLVLNYEKREPQMVK